uniref:Uncharacterized protein n=1 Tax=Palpitomonas bilix TaxID=652834 RepID=A0A7S3GF03_9EUKA|mmetsp:Transcript_46502/g.120003  ORF Transcript_46502/g.120003 Transcript_46502/m.120003 type:complete len:508 (+) Transcript_46502:836-2359(+)
MFNVPVSMASPICAPSTPHNGRRDCSTCSLHSGCAQRVSGKRIDNRKLDGRLLLQHLLTFCFTSCRLLVEQPEDTVLVDLDIGNISVQTDVTPAPKVELNTLKETLLHVTRSPKAILQRQRKWTDKQRSSFFARKTINLGSKRGRSASLDDVGRARSKAQTPDLSHLGMELTDTATATVRTACGYAFWSICSPVMKAAEAGEGKATDVHARDADGKEWHISTAVLDSLDGERKPFFQVFKQSQIFVELLDRHVSRDESLVEFENIGETYPALVKTVEGSKAQEQQQSRKRGGLSRFLRSDSKREVPTDLLLAAMGSDRRARGLASSCAGAELSGREVTFYCRDPSQEGLSGAVTTPFFARKSFASELLEARDGVDPFPESLLQPTDESASAADSGRRVAQIYFLCLIAPSTLLSKRGSLSSNTLNSLFFPLFVHVKAAAVSSMASAAPSPLFGVTASISSRQYAEGEGRPGSSVLSMSTRVTHPPPLLTLKEMRFDRTTARDSKGAS